MGNRLDGRAGACAKVRCIAIRFELGERAGRRRGVRLLAAARERAQPARARRAEASRAAARAGCARCARFPRRCGARSTRSSFLYRWTLPDCILPDRDVRLRRLRGRARAASPRCAPTSSPSTCCARSTTTAAARGPRGGASSRRRTFARDALKSRRRRSGPRHGAPPRCIFDDPHALVERFASLLEAYWEHAFAAEWERIEPQLAESVELAGRADRERRHARVPASRSRRSSASTPARAQLRARRSARPPRPDRRRRTRCCSCRASTSGRTCGSTAIRRGRSRSSTARRTSSRACDASTPPRARPLLKALGDPTRLRILELAREAAAQHAGARAARRASPTRERRSSCACSHRPGC